MRVVLRPTPSSWVDKPEVVKESYVIDYTSPTFNTLVMEEEGGFDYRWVYGLQRLSVHSHKALVICTVKSRLGVVHAEDIVPIVRSGERKLRH